MRLSALTCAFLSVTALPVLAQNTLPTDAKPTCALDKDTFTSWIVDENGGNPIFAPPPSFATNFDTPSLCPFYTWSAQMFLWLTSPTGDNMWVFNDVGFYNVVHSAAGSEKVAQVTVEPNTPGIPSAFTLRSRKGDAVGQAGGDDVLISRNGALTYYGMHVNDAYVAFRDGVLARPDDFNFTDGNNTQTHQFPSSEADMAAVAAYGEDIGLIEDFEAALSAGTLELKTSWVPLDSLDNALRDQVLTLDAVVPIYNKSDSKLWPDTGTDRVTLAMVGMHIAGPVVGHPELVWASFEHLANGPINTYVYTSASDEQKTVDYSGAGTWIYASDGAPLPDKIVATAHVQKSDTEHAKKGDIVVTKDANVATNSPKISSVDVIQMNPWGNAPGTVGDVVSNTDLISLNASIMDYLDGDPSARNAYYQLGAVWTDGTLPVYPDTGSMAGGLRLANSTMETFHQFDAQNTDPNFTSQNCFSCHGPSGPKGDPTLNNGTNVSHIFDGMAAYTK